MAQDFDKREKHLQPEGDLVDLGRQRYHTVYRGLLAVEQGARSMDPNILAKLLQQADVDASQVQAQANVEAAEKLDNFLTPPDANESQRISDRLINELQQSVNVEPENL